MRVRGGMDLAAARNDLAAFADLAGRPLTTWQADALRLDRPVTVVCSNRQAGKSRSLAVLAPFRAYREPGHRVLIVSAGEEAAKRLLAEVRSLVTGSPFLRGSVVDETAGLVTLSNGSEIRSVPASERQVRGWSVDTLLVDEAALVSDDLILGAAFPTTAARPDARIVLTSSPITTTGTFYNHLMLGRQGAEHVAAFTWALADCSWISPSVVEAARASMSPMRFAAEYLGEPASASDALFPRHTVERQTAPYVMPGLHGLGEAAGVAGIDWGATTDRTALVSIGRFRVPDAAFGVVCAHAWPSGAQLDGPGGIIGEVAGLGAVFEHFTAETNGLGFPLTQSLERRFRERAVERRPRFESVFTSGPMKAAAYGALRVLFEQGRLLLPEAAEALIRELLLLRVQLTLTGGERIEAGTGHDDLSDGLALALGPYQDSSGEWRTRLGDVAERLPAPSSAPADGDVVRTGGGLVIPRVPSLVKVGVSARWEVTTEPWAELYGHDGEPVIERGGMTLQGDRYLDRGAGGELVVPNGYRRLKGVIE